MVTNSFLLPVSQQKSIFNSFCSNAKRNALKSFILLKQFKDLKILRNLGGLNVRTQFRNQNRKETGSERLQETETNGGIEKDSICWQHAHIPRLTKLTLTASKGCHSTTLCRDRPLSHNLWIHMCTYRKTLNRCVLKSSETQ